MPESEGRDVRRMLERLRTSMARVFDALLAPYEALADRDPDGAIGPPVDSRDMAAASRLRELAADILGAGRETWYFEQVEERAAQLEDLVNDYRRGLYRETTAAHWIGRVHSFRDVVFADVNTAMQAPRGWEKLALGDVGRAGRRGLHNRLLTPQDVAPELRLNERTVRRRIQAGTLGPWRKDGARWVIGRDAFLRYWSDQLVDSDSDVPRPPQPNHTPSELQERLEHVRLQP